MVPRCRARSLRSNDHLTLTAMRTLLSIPGLFAMILHTATPAQDQEGTLAMSRTDLPSQPLAIPAGGTRYDLVDRCLRPTADPAGALQRAVQLRPDGLYEVRVTSAYGTLKMSGTYRDAA